MAHATLFTQTGCNFAQLAEVIQVVTGHGFRRRIERSSFRARDASSFGWLHRAARRESIADSICAARRKRRAPRQPELLSNARPTCPDRKADCGPIFGQRLAETECEDNLAIGKVAYDLGWAPLAGSGGTPILLDQSR